MERMITLIVAGTLGSIGTLHAQQPQPAEEQEPQGIPATPHQEEAVREISSDLFERLDANHDGSISRSEAQAEPALTESWSEYDANADQALDQAELSAYETTSSQTAESEDIEVAEGGSTVRGLPTSPHQEQAVRNELVQLLDEDGDSAISRSEAEGESDLIAEWDQLDRNADGKLDADELGEIATEQ